ncbi:hypothetical protein TV39_14650 [Arthrobacter sp. SPG23]|uniref:hypothetical protein n=1 Tax=Arthrobacter sp. SPG23 TaxID=1610703 RepID=UPI0005B934FB|nr:hypothetical protein [Arthrobacter sp. SPG23]KIS26528.1 hypothetical protein TV39_14650 [Arthrobacter sp. SPG23]
MRTFVSAAAVILGLLLAAVAVPAIWVDRNIVQEDGFVSLAAPLGKDAVFQERLASAAVGSIDPAGRIPEPFTELVQPILDAAAKSLTTLPGYPAAWEETLRKSHRLNFQGSGSGSTDAEPSTSLTLDVAPLVGLLTKQISEATNVPLDAPDQTLIGIGQPSQRQLVDQVSAYAPMGSAVAAGSAIALLLALIAARRRWIVLVGTGAGALVLAAVWKLGSDAAGLAVGGTASGNEVADIFKSEFVAASSERFGQWILATLIAGAVLIVAGVILRVVAGAVVSGAGRDQRSR